MTTTTKSSTQHPGEERRQRRRAERCTIREECSLLPSIECIKKRSNTIVSIHASYVFYEDIREQKTTHHHQYQNEAQNERKRINKRHNRTNYLQLVTEAIGWSLQEHKWRVVVERNHRDQWCSSKRGFGRCVSYRNCA